MELASVYAPDLISPCRSQFSMQGRLPYGGADTCAGVRSRCPCPGLVKRCWTHASTAAANNSSRIQRRWSISLNCSTNGLTVRCTQPGRDSKPRTCGDEAVLQRTCFCMHPSKWCSRPPARRVDGTGWELGWEGIACITTTHSLAIAAAAEDVDVPRPAMVVASRAWTTHSVRQPCRVVR